MWEKTKSLKDNILVENLKLSWFLKERLLKNSDLEEQEFQLFTQGLEQEH
jgi:hypothetical protein